MSKNTVYFSTTGWECPVCHKGCAPQALKCEHCAEAKARRKEPTADEMKRAMENLFSRPDGLEATCVGVTIRPTQPTPDGLAAWDTQSSISWPLRGGIT